MISIIICSRSAAPDQSLQRNIEKTIGVACEVIYIDNSANQFGICKAYNLGIERSKYAILCFMHDDIEYRTNNWGETVLNHFGEEQVAAIGVAGTSYRAFMPGPWWSSGNLHEYLLQSSATNAVPALKSTVQQSQRPEVVTFDGVWFCIRRSAFETIRFDEINFKGFHLYDMDICMQLYNRGLKMYGISDVLIHHLSMGSVNSEWIENDLVFHRKWRKALPASLAEISNNQSFRYEYRTLNAFIWICFANGWSNKKIYSQALKFLLAFKKGYSFYKTPAYFLKFAFKLFFKKGAPFYAN